MNIFSIAGLAVVAAVVCLLLRQYRPEYAMVVSLGCGALLFAAILDTLTPVFAVMDGLMQKTSMDPAYVGAIAKTLGICYVTQLASDACRDAGQTAIASKVELAGKVFVLLIALPMFEQLVEIAFSLIGTGS